MKRFYTESDAGGVRIGINGSFTVLIPNGYGDGKTEVIIYDEEIKMDHRRFFTSIEGSQINIYAFDCGCDELVYTLSGKYDIYIIGDDKQHKDKGAVCFVRIDEQKTNNEGAEEKLLRKINVLEEAIKNCDDERWENVYQNQLNICRDFLDIMRKEGLLLYNNPASDSFYLYPNNEEFSYKDDKEGSYRMAARWNYGDNMRRSDQIKNNDFAIGKCKNGKYIKIRSCKTSVREMLNDKESL